MEVSSKSSAVSPSTRSLLSYSGHCSGHTLLVLLLVAATSARRFSRNSSIPKLSLHSCKQGSDMRVRLSNLRAAREPAHKPEFQEAVAADRPATAAAVAAAAAAGVVAATKLDVLLRK